MEKLEKQLLMYKRIKDTQDRIIQKLEEKNYRLQKENKLQAEIIGSMVTARYSDFKVRKDEGKH